ncbi:uncharacterized protein E0L32_012411 [Thyridium curvatum]|uniref:Uncharacterized protein n=1 Tax=Thyridium curvatum TaxID=1093900 RepID=A0A507B2V7_9PEZI|nr:uncharacterized protein E0L32_012411 [Thyridium curvatum]TPX16602.1 hypothetical protein E0L32_012411 [Thyridium curvatum]
MRRQQQGLLSLVLPLLASGQSLVTGDPPANGAGPYGIPEDKFRQALSSSPASEVSAASYPVPGYRVDAPSTDGNASGSDLQDDSWRLGIDVYANVPLRDVPRASDADKGKYARVTTVSLGHSPAVDMGASWRLCATVYLGLAAAAADASKKQAGDDDDGTCAQLLPSDCLKQLQVQAESRGIAADGTCSTPGVPPKCEEHIVGNGTAFGERCQPLYLPTYLPSFPF